MKIGDNFFLSVYLKKNHVLKRHRVFSHLLLSIVTPLSFAMLPKKKKKEIKSVSGGISKKEHGFVSQGNTTEH